MHEYLVWDKKIITDFSDENINSLYNNGYVFTREKKGSLDQTRSVRINLDKFELSSENRRILRKTEELKLEVINLPCSDYHWSIGKLAKDFYDEKFEKNTFSANKVREILTLDSGNFNKLFTYKNQGEGYCIVFENQDILHYSYPFYDLKNLENKNIGMGMMIKAITYAKENNKKYIYLGSAQRPTDTYKLQFKGLEWFDGEGWSGDLNKLKEILKR
jgi:leucyl-tRNA---protein transferase